MGIVPSGIFRCRPGTMIGVTVQTPMCAGIIGTKIQTGYAAAFCPLVSIFAHRKRPAADPRNQLIINAFSMSDSQGTKFNFFSLHVSSLSPPVLASALNSSAT